MNRRTAESAGGGQNIEVKALCYCFKILLLFEIPCSIFDIQNTKKAGSRFKLDCKFGQCILRQNQWSWFMGLRRRRKKVDNL